MSSTEGSSRNIPTERNITISPLSTPAVVGFPDDRNPAGRGTGSEEIAALARLLESANIPCCVVGVHALQYYGAGRISLDWSICVPTEKFSRAKELVLTRADTYMPFERSPMRGVHDPKDIWDRFKLVDVKLFFVLGPSNDCYLDVRAEKIEHDADGVPYPTLPAFVQSLIDTTNRVDLDDVVDGMDLSVEWGEKLLDLDSETDLTHLVQRVVDTGVDPVWIALDPNPVKKRPIWEKSAGGKQERLGHKFSADHHATRFRKRGTKKHREALEKQMSYLAEAERKAEREAMIGKGWSERAGSYLPITIAAAGVAFGCYAWWNNKRGTR